MKFLLFLLVLAGIWWWRGAVARQKPRVEQRPVERMVACECCGVHMPESDAIQENGRYFCCAAHQKNLRNKSGND